MDERRDDCPFCGEGYGSEKDDRVIAAWKAYDELERLRSLVGRWLREGSDARLQD